MDYSGDEFIWNGDYKTSKRLVYGQAVISLEIDILVARTKRWTPHRYGRPMYYRAGHTVLRWDHHTKVDSGESWRSFVPKQKFKSRRSLLDWFERWIFSDRGMLEFESLLWKAWSVRRISCVYKQNKDGVFEPFCTLYPHSDLLSHRLLPPGQYYLIDVDDGREHSISMWGSGYTSGSVKGLLNLHRWDDLRHGLYNGRMCLG